MTGSRGFFWQRYSLKTRFPNVAGLKTGSPVRVAGVEVGSVTDVVFAGEQVDVVFEVNKEVRPRITTASTARARVGLAARRERRGHHASSTGTPIPDWGYVPTGKSAAALADVTDQAQRGHRRSSPA